MNNEEIKINLNLMPGHIAYGFAVECAERVLFRHGHKFNNTHLPDAIVLAKRRQNGMSYKNEADSLGRKIAIRAEVYKKITGESILPYEDEIALTILMEDQWWVAFESSRLSMLRPFLYKDMSTWVCDLEFDITEERWQKRRTADLLSGCSI